MTIETCMGLVDAMLPNRIPEAVKLCLLGEVEGKVRVELLGQEPAEGALFPDGTPHDTELAVPHPFDQLYWQYLLAMLSHLSGDNARYENTAALFNATYQGYGKWLKRRGA